MGGEGSSNVQRYLGVLPIAPRQIDRGDEQESCNPYADIPALLVEESHIQLIVPSCIHKSEHDWPLLEDQGKFIISTFINVFLALWIVTSGQCSLRGNFLWFPIVGWIHVCYNTGYGNIGSGSGGCIGHTQIVHGCSWCIYNGFVGWKVLRRCRFGFRISFFFFFVFIYAMGFSSDITSLEPRILIKRSMFLPCVVVRMGNGIFSGSVYIKNSGGSWWSTSTLL